MVDLRWSRWVLSVEMLLASISIVRHQIISLLYCLLYSLMLHRWLKMMCCIQWVTKSHGVYLGWPIAPSYMSPNAGEGGCQWVQLCTGSPNKLWWSNSIHVYWSYGCMTGMSCGRRRSGVSAWRLTSAPPLGRPSLSGIHQLFWTHFISVH